MSEIKKELINSSQIQTFLEDFEKNSTIELLSEDSKEQNEIFEIAKARGIILKDRQCLAGFKTIYMFADRKNLNSARVPKKELLKGLPSLVGTPIDFDHQRQIICGAYIDYRYIVKDDSVIAYGVFYKNNFSEDWATVQKLFKSGKLTTSYEILSPKNKRVNLADGTFELHDIEIAGGALLLREKPAFPDAKVLSFAKINVDENLVYASKYRCEDIIINGESKCQNCGKCKKLEVAEEKKPETPKVETIKMEEKKIEAPKVEEVKPIAPVAPVVPVAPVIPAPIVIPKIKCSNCQHSFDAPKVATSEIKCNECFAIINDKGDILYPPQVIDFNISCPSCSSRNWRLLKKEEDSGEIKCMSCAKKYEIAFSKVKSNELLNMLQFLRVGHVSCKQCGRYISYSGSSKVTIYNLSCIKCGLNFTYDIEKDGQVKQLSTIKEIIEPAKASIEIPSKADELNIDKSAIKEEAKGEIKMEQIPVENIVEVASTPDAKSEVAEVKEVIAELPVEAKVEEKIVEVAKVEEIVVVAPVVEVAKVEEVVVPVIEPIVEAKVEVAPIIEVKVEAPVEAKTEEVIDASLPPEIVTLIKEYTKDGMKMPEAIKKAWKEYKKAQKASKTSRKAIATKIKKTRKAIKASVAKIEFYKANAEEINKRRKELGDSAKDVSDEDLIDNTKFSDAKLIQANLETSSIVGTKKTDEDNLNKYRKEIQDKAEGRIKRAK